MRGHISFQFEGKEINLLFNTWAFRLFCDNRGIRLDEFFEIMNSSVKMSDYVDLMKCAAQSYAMKFKQPFEVTDYEVSEWFDELFYKNGGNGFTAINGALIRSLTVETTEPETPKEQEEKKS